MPPLPFVYVLIAATVSRFVHGTRKLLNISHQFSSQGADVVSSRDHECPPSPPPYNHFKPLQIEISDALKISPKYGDVMRISDLKRQQNLRLQTIAKCMNNSYGIVMKKAKRRKRNRTEVRLQWIINQEIKASIKLKYLTRQFPNIYIHQIDVIDWTYISNLSRTILKTEGNIVINQMADMSLVSNPNIMYESLIHPLLNKLVAVYSMNWTNTTEIVPFLSRLPYHLPPRLFNVIMSKLYSSKIAKIKSIRTKLLPKLKALHDELFEIYFVAFNKYEQVAHPLLYLKNCSIQMVWNRMKPFLDLKHKDNRSFFQLFKSVIISVCSDEINRRHRIPKPQAKSLMANPWSMHVRDAINIYWLALLSQQNLHILSPRKLQWYFGDVTRHLSELLIAKQNVPMGIKDILAEAIIKVVLH